MMEALGWGVAAALTLGWCLTWRHLRAGRDLAVARARSAREEAGQLQAELADVRAAAARRIRASEDEARHAVSGLAGALLPVEDALDRAAEAEGSFEVYREGVRLVQRQLGLALSKGGLSCVAPQEGATFDPRTQSCLAEVPGDEGGELVVHRIERRGWLLHDRLLRPAQVVVQRREAFCHEDAETEEAEPEDAEPEEAEPEDAEPEEAEPEEDEPEDDEPEAAQREETVEPDSPEASVVRATVKEEVKHEI